MLSFQRSRTRITHGRERGRQGFRARRLRTAFAAPGVTSGDARRVWNEVANRLFYPRMPFVALSADALSALLTADEKTAWGIDPRDALHKALAASQPVP